MAMPADTFANFSCEGRCRRKDFRVQTLRNERMSSADNMSLPDRVRAYARLAAFAGASLGLVVSDTVAAAEPPVTVEYQSSFAGHRRFDAQAPAVAWRQANDAIGNVSKGDTHGMHGMHVPAEPAPADTNESPPTTSGDHREHRQ
jgi:hypothetical protein